MNKYLKFRVGRNTDLIYVGHIEMEGVLQVVNVGSDILFLDILIQRYYSFCPFLYIFL